MSVQTPRFPALPCPGGETGPRFRSPGQRGPAAAPWPPSAPPGAGADEVRRQAGRAGGSENEAAPGPPAALGGGRRREEPGARGRQAGLCPRLCPPGRCGPGWPGPDLPIPGVDRERKSEPPVPPQAAGTMTFQWTAVAAFLYGEIGVILVLCVPFISPLR